MGVQRKQCFDGSGWPKDLKNFLDLFSDEELGFVIMSFQPGKRDSLVSGPQYTHHLDYEGPSSDGKWHLFSVAPDSGGTKASEKLPKGKTKYVCHIGIAQNLFYDVPDGFGTIARAALWASRVNAVKSSTHYVLVDGSIHATLEKAIEAEKELLKSKAPAATHAPNGKPYWNWEEWGHPLTNEDFKKYETQKPKDKKSQQQQQQNN
ncbi:Secreted protein [Lasiodiplodia theobromae]|uniref:Secreted protein n=1 Tax=Lasiodiplodia theobromae TaxID=45133 RepID=UPI0015C3D067|nr:Secreted protein [Lasiodiplodia theobromae]KAF4546236.1 Secreted protein [Lasiodiplodia theobromae]